MENFGEKIEKKRKIFEEKIETLKIKIPLLEAELMNYKHLRELTTNF